jgi:hypothetical protein
MPSRLGWIAITSAALAALAVWAGRTIAVYDDCLDRIDYVKARQHLCDADPSIEYPRTPH